MTKHPQPNTTYIACKINPSLKTAFERRAREQDISVSTYLRRLIRRELNGQSGQTRPEVSGGSGEQRRAA